MPVSQPLAYQLFAVRRCIPLSFESSRLLLCCGLVTLISWLATSCVPRVARDFVSRLGGLGHDFVLEERLVEAFLVGPRLVAAV